MKKTLISIVVLSMAIISLAFSACSGKKDSVSGSGTAKESGKKSEKSNGKANPESDFKFEANSDFSQIMITEYIGKGSNVVIPAEIQGVPVTKVKIWLSQELKSIVIPEGVVAISFNGNDYSALSSVKLPSTLKCIWKFWGAPNLSSIELPDSLEVLIEFGNTGITKLDLPSSLKYIWGCYSNNKLESITMTEDIKLSGFYECNLTEVIHGEKISSSIALQKQLKNVKLSRIGNIESLYKEYYIEKF